MFTRQIAYLFFGLILAIAAYGIDTVFLPSPEAVQARIERDYIEQPRQVSRNENLHKKIASDPETGEETFLYIYSFNRITNEGYVVSLETIRDADIIRKLDASRMVWNEEMLNWRLEDVKVHDFTSEGESLQFFDHLDTALLVTPDDLFIKEIHAQSIPLDELEEVIELEKLRGSPMVEELEYEMVKRKISRIVLLLLLAGCGFLTLFGAIKLAVQRKQNMLTPVLLGLTLLALYGGAIFGGKILTEFLLSDLLTYGPPIGLLAIAAALIFIAGNAWSPKAPPPFLRN